jgi:hypothetical protein
LGDFAAALHRAYPVPDVWLRTLTDDTIVCRCEEVTAEAIRGTVERDAATDARTAKLLVRPGMGWCQGRICGYATERLVHDAARRVGPPTIAVPERPLVVPVRLGLLANAVPGSTERQPDSTV